MGVSSKTAAVAKMHGHSVMIDALLGGTEAMRAAGKAYLPQWPREEDDSYQTRLGTSTLLPVLTAKNKLRSRAAPLVAAANKKCVHRN